ncbi:regulator of G-protein signaling rgs-2-like isoform X1 [Haliotis rubra]|uniref:regulator of G-protein signaling rgs-2-like isoform X1 n=1 Tax=Haliotis rubra TaxID=36100 RepID=UPI001EE51581|nr:regulator of G-protein signaling rgs-2-like isoform X1 [Haliotis rubra]
MSEVMVVLRSYGMSAATVLHRQSSGSTDNDVRMRNNRPVGGGQQPTSTAESPPSSPGQSAERTTRGCCFCWSVGLAMKSNNGNQEQRPKDTKLGTIPEKDDPPTIEEVKSWGESFDKLMKSGRKVFREFLRSEYSEENMLFWQACEDLKQEQNPELVEEKARLIYEDYISILSPKEVSLDSRVREVINRNMVDPTPHTFDEAQLQIYTLMHRDSYPRFLNSQIYKRLVQQTS